MDTNIDQWIKRNLPHTLVWSNGVSGLEVYVRDRWLHVGFFPSIKNKQRSIYTDIKLSEHSAKIADMLGNSEGTDFHNRKIGTLLGNLAIRALRIIYADKIDSVIVSGETCPETRVSDGVAHDEDVARRATFWSRFGLEVEDPTSPRSHMEAPLSQLVILDRGQIAEGISTTIPLSDFWRNYHSPRAYTKDINTLREVEMPVGDLNRIISWKDLNAWETKLDRLANYPVILYLITLVAGGVFIYLKTDLPKIVDATLLLIAVFSYSTVSGIIFNFAKLLLSFTTGFSARKTERTQALDAKRGVLKELETQNPGALQRILDVMKAVFPEHVGPHLHAKGIGFDRTTDAKEVMQEIGELIKSFQKQCANSINVKRLDQSHDVADFIFPLCKNYVYVGELLSEAEFLGDAFEFHINRLLKDIPSHELYISGASDADPRKVLDKLSCIARIDFYTENCAYSDYGSFHMKVHLQEGTLNFRATWATYKPGRVHESVPLLLYLAGRHLTSKCFIIDGDSRVKAPDDTMDFICAVFDLANCKNYSVADIQEAIGRQNWIEQRHTN